MLPAGRGLARKRYESGHVTGSVEGSSTGRGSVFRRASVPPNSSNFLILDPEDVRNRGHSEGSFPWEEDSQAGRSAKGASQDAAGSQDGDTVDEEMPLPPPPPSEASASSEKDAQDETEASGNPGFVLVDEGKAPDTTFVLVENGKTNGVDSGAVPTPSDPVSADALAARIDQLENRLEEHSKEAVRAIADAAGQDTEASKKAEVSSLTPAQIALLYKTLQCGDVSPRRIVKSVGTGQVSPKEIPRLAYPTQTLRSEGLQLEGARSSKMDQLRDAQLYSRSATSTEIKRQFWNARAASIQAAWRGYRTRIELLAQMNAHSSNAHRRGGGSMDTRSNGSTDSSGGAEEGALHGRRENAIRGKRRTTTSAGAEVALHMYKVLRGRNKAPLTAASVVSKLRQSRSGVRKTPFDLLLDRCIKALLHLPPTDQYTTLLPSNFVQLVESTPCLQELAEQLDSMSRDGSLMFVREPASKARPLSVTARESQLLQGLYRKFAGEAPIMRARVLAEALHEEAGLAPEVATLLVNFARSQRVQQFAHLGPADLVAFVEEQTTLFSHSRHANPGEVLLALAARVKRARAADLAAEARDSLGVSSPFRAPPTSAPPPSLLPPQFPFASLKEAAKFHASRYL
ncbi:Hypothetical Protein FCC1311_106852 [Hondaea fermentalgiana]|uniref:Uncharacterized protein n=1 Tax=Hondaea fermentalgiana TaxID=2315210 RepID=A0A2R5H106_9STRA|nr:Hypothetical Protein FCC1311_106852 [Hondaea fermentalgiana]|eukprot:GBG34461.1 Hypothetical Protein FCC1311_106852 [Hondaea fermentalgiana]